MKELAWLGVGAIAFVTNCASAQNLALGLDGEVVGALVANLSSNKSFSAVVEIEVTGGATPGSFQCELWQDGDKFRSFVDMAKAKSYQITPDRLAVYQQAGLDRTATIRRWDKKAEFTVFPGVPGYLEKPLSASDANSRIRFSVRKTLLGEEKMADHPCHKFKIEFNGAARRTGVAWCATDLRNSPVEIHLDRQALDGTATLRFKDIKFDKPDPKLFEVPADFKRYADMEKLAHSLDSRLNPPPK